MNKSLSNRVWMIVSIILVIAFVTYVILYPPGQKSKTPTQSLATVNGVSISKESLYNALVASSGQQTMETLINNELVRQAAEKAGIVVTDADVDKELDAIRQNFSTEDEFLQTLTMYGMTLDGLKNDMTTQAQLRKLLEPQVKVTDDDIQKYYDENLESLKTPEKAQASHIQLATKEGAEAVLAELNEGAEFAATAKEKSTDSATKDNGGELDYFAKADKEEAISNAVFALEVGQVSKVVEASDGFHIYKLTDRQAAVTPTMDEKKEEIRETLTADQITELSQTWIQEQQSTAKIENSLATAD